MSRALVVVSLAVAVLAAACGGAGDDTSGEDRVRVVTTTTILGDVVKQIAGDAVELEVLMGPGVDPHAFQPSAAQALALREADLVVANGLGLEESLVDVLAAAESDGVAVLRLAEQLDPIPYTAGAHGDDEHEDDEHELDPHVWFDVGRMADGATIVADAIAAADAADDTQTWQARGEAYAEELRALDDEVRETLAAIPTDRRRLVTNHDAFGYLAVAYDLEIVGTVVPGAGTQSQSSAAAFAELAELLRGLPVPVVFTENTTSDRLATALAAEVGPDVRVVALYSDAVGEPGSEVATYVDLVRHDAEAIADALS